jgi:uncharacterized protein YggE
MRAGLCLLTTGILWLSEPVVLTAQDRSPQPGISVTGIGRVTARPTVVELSGIVVGDGELAGDAVTKFRTTRQSAAEAIEALEIPGLSLEGTGISVNSAMDSQQMQALMRGMPVQPGSSGRLSVSEPIKIRLTGIQDLDAEQLLETLVKIVDAGKDAGIVIGEVPSNYRYGYNTSNRTPLARFKLENVDELKQQAFQQAMNKAREQALNLAQLAGVTLGHVTGVREGNISMSSSQQVVYYYPGMQEEPQDEFTKTDLSDIAVTVVLQVDFAITP